MNEEVIEQKSSLIPTVSTIFIFFAFLAISIAFLYLLNVVVSPDLNLAPGDENPYDFSFLTIIYALVISIMATLFFAWLKNYMRKSPYMGLILGLTTLGLFIYAITQKFIGPYTTTFIIIVSAIVLGYLGVFFYKYRTNPEPDESYDESTASKK